MAEGIEQDPANSTESANTGMRKDVDSLRTSREPAMRLASQPRPDSRSGGANADLERSLMQSFIEGATWPIDCASLAALSDMGLGAEGIARYFAVDVAAVRRLLTSEDVTVSIPETDGRIA
jgi:hypothetical protein